MTAHTDLDDRDKYLPTPMELCRAAIAVELVERSGRRQGSQGRQRPGAAPRRPGVPPKACRVNGPS